jgi:hypothetical protein
VPPNIAAIAHDSFELKVIRHPRFFLVAHHADAPIYPEDGMKAGGAPAINRHLADEISLPGPGRRPPGGWRDMAARGTETYDVFLIYFKLVIRCDRSLLIMRPPLFAREFRAH